MTSADAFSDVAFSNLKIATLSLSAMSLYRVFDVADDEGHVEFVRVPLFRIEGVRQLVLSLSGQHIVVVELVSLL